MTIPFLDFFKKLTGRSGTTTEATLPAPAPAAPPPRPKPTRVEKPEHERLSKTVLPNTSRPAPTPDPYRSATGAQAATGSPNRPTVAGPTVPQKRELPPAVALALQPKVERAIALQLSDVLSEIPDGFVKSAETFDTSRRILLKASEIEKGMATGKPTVSLATIYAQVPEIFLHSLAPDQTVDVALPFEKVLEQFQSAQVRNDQELDQDIPQVETPILQVTIEDTQRFGTTVQRLQTSAHPPVKVEPMTAETISIAQPEPIGRGTVAAQPARGVPLNAPVGAAPPPLPKTSESSDPVAPARIPFKLPPNGTDVSESERVPASNGPSVPTGVTKAPTSARIPFKITPTHADLKPKLTLVPGTEPPNEKEPAAPTSAPAIAPAPAVAATPIPAPAPAAAVAVPVSPAPAAPAIAPKSDDSAKISLSLCAIMQNLPAFQLQGSPESVPADVRVEFPMTLVEPQLATGRVAIPAKEFQAAVPEAYRSLFVVDSTETSVLLPLQEVLKNLPAASLKMRADQEVVETAETFETPFSLKAREDAERFNAPAQPVKVEEPASAPAPQTEMISEQPELPKLEVSSAKEVLPNAPETRVEAVEPPAIKPVDASPAPPAETLKPIELPKAEAPVVEKVEASVPVTVEAAAEESDELPKPIVPIDIKGRKEKNEAKDVVARASALPGVAACSISFSDGLALTGNLPIEVSADGLCAMAPSVLQKIDRHMQGTKLGPLSSMTLHGAKSPITFFMQGNICLNVLHAGGELAPETQTELAQMAKQLSRTYSQPESSHVHH